MNKCPQSLRSAPPAELCSHRTVSGGYSIAGHQLSHAPSRQRLKLKRSALTIRLCRSAHASSILGDGGVHLDPTACPKHLSLSFGASSPSQASTWLPAISSATTHRLFPLHGCVYVANTIGELKQVHADAMGIVCDWCRHGCTITLADPGGIRGDGTAQGGRSGRFPLACLKCMRLLC